MARSKCIFDDVKKELECTVCQEQYSEINEPKILKCLHTFCKTCLQAWIRQHREGELSCPTCRRITECPDRDINRLPSNLFYKQMLEIVEAYSGQGQEDSSQCGNCEQKKSLKFYCSDCNYFLCEHCAETHKIWKSFREHHIKEIGSFNSSDVQDYARKANVCKKHKDELRYYCDKCKNCICRDCAILDHRDHNIISFEQGLDSKKSEITKRMQDIGAVGSLLRQQIEALQKQRTRVDHSIDQATYEVHRFAEHCRSLIRKHEATKTKELLNHKASFAAEFASQVTALDAKIKDVNSSLEFGKDVLERNNLPEILNVEETLERRFQDFLSSPEFSLSIEMNNCGVKYVPRDISNIENELGKLFFSNTEPSLSTAQGKGLTEGLQGEDCSFTIVTKDWQGKTTYNESDLVIVDIQSSQTGKVTKSSIKVAKDGCYEVKYRPEDAGEFRVSITVGGEIIKDSPFDLKVFEAKQTASNASSKMEEKKPKRKLSVAKKVLEYSHKLGGSELRPQRFVPKEPSEVFRQVEAHINFEKFHISPKDMLDVLKENTEVEHRNGPKNCILVGTFNQIEAAHKLLHHLIEMDVGKEATEIHRDNDTTSTQQDSTRAFDDAVTTSFEVQPQFMNLLKHVYKSKLQGMEENFGVKILWDENASQVHICQNEMSQGQSRFQDGCDAFIDLYQEFHPKVRREEVHIPHEANKAQLLEAINHVQAQNPAIVEKVENILVVHAEKDSVSSSVQALKEELGLTKEGSNRKTRRGQQNSSRDPREDNESRQLGRFPLAQRLNQDLRNGVSLSLYQGDITDERVDAIVNAANEWLHHGAGVAGAILRKGGRQIQDESDWITRKHGSLNVGKAAYTSGGVLPCRYVIHAVGPRWMEHGREGCISLLRQACLESLHVAVQLELSSIALPAISSGIFGMPKDICAQVMFKAIEEFSASDAVNFSTLRDLRIVIIDEPTLRVFQEEFVKRYRSKGTSL